MGKQIAVSFIVAVLASIATSLVILSLGQDDRHAVTQRLAEIERQTSRAIEEAAQKNEVALRRVARAEQAAASAQRDATVARAAIERGAAPGEATSEGGALTAPDGTEYVSLAELNRLLDERAAAGPGEGPPPTPQMTLAEVAEEIGLTASQEATLDVILRESEDEMFELLFGERTIEDVLDQARRARDDPDELSRLIQPVATRAMANVGHLMTFEKRRRARIKDAIGDELASRFLQHDVKSPRGDEVERLFAEVLSD